MTATESDMAYEPVGTIAVLTTAHSRYTLFWVALIRQLGQPPQPVKVDIKVGSVNLARTRNDVLSEAEGEWVWFLDDDHDWDPTMLQRLLARNVDIVAPVILKREEPFGPVHMIKVPEAYQEEGKPWGNPALEDSESGLQEVDSVGCAGMLVRRHVWESFPRPWFTCGQVSAPDVMSEDVAFCLGAKAQGWKVYVDLDETMDHFMPVGIAPTRNKAGEWHTRVALNRTNILIPKAAVKFQIPKLKLWTPRGDR